MPFVNLDELGGVVESTDLVILLTPSEAELVRKNKRLMAAFYQVSRHAIERYIASTLPDSCPKTEKPHRFVVDQDETSCIDCGKKPVGEHTSNKAPFVDVLALHLKELSFQNSGPDLRKCTECGTRLWLPTDGIWTENRAEWETPASGALNCREFNRRRKEGTL